MTEETFLVGDTVGLQLKNADKFWLRYMDAIGFVLGFVTVDDPNPHMSAQVWWPGHPELTLHWPISALVHCTAPQNPTFQQALADADRFHALHLAESGRTSFTQPTKCFLGLDKPSAGEGNLE